MRNNLVLILNCGSSSIKFAIIEPNSGINSFSGIVQNIGSQTSNIKFRQTNETKTQNLPNIDYRDALQFIIKLIRSLENGVANNITAIGHRVVHGSEKFKESVVITDEVLQTIRESIHLAPLHNPANIIGIEETIKAFPKLLQVAVFDTAFHQAMPDYAYIYPVPYEFYKEHRVRKYGFHGTSHRFVSNQAATTLQLDINKSAFITAHLGNGCSAAAILNGKSIDTSMGLTPLEGLVMGTRSGDVDPGLIAYLVDNLGLDVHKVTDILNKKSGLLGISGTASDMRTIEDNVMARDLRSTLAFEIFCYRLAKYIGALAVPLGKIDALIFTGGIGENSPMVREKTINWLKIFNFKLDTINNESNGKNSNGIVTTKDSTIAIVVPTNEELLIAKDTILLAKTSN